jgi:hypothetical protein
MFSLRGIVKHSVVKTSTPVSRWRVKDLEQRSIKNSNILIRNWKRRYEWLFFLEDSVSAKCIFEWPCSCYTKIGRSGPKHFTAAKSTRWVAHKKRLLNSYQKIFYPGFYFPEGQLLNFRKLSLTFVVWCLRIMPLSYKSP